MEQYKDSVDVLSDLGTLIPNKAWITGDGVVLGVYNTAEEFSKAYASYRYLSEKDECLNDCYAWTPSVFLYVQLPRAKRKYTYFWPWLWMIIKNIFKK